MDVVAGRFALVDLVATGGSGAVWRARDLRLDQVCAAKVLRQRDSGDLLRFVREKGVQLDHPHVLTPYSWAAEDAHVVIASRLVSGGTLGALLDTQGPLAPATAADLLDQLLDALEHVHAAGWVHRDVTVANLLLEPTGAGWPELSLADFGIAVHPAQARLTEVGAVLGTPGYLAPEVLDGAAPAPARDLYAAGVVGLRLLGTDREDLPAAGHDRLSDTLRALTAPDPRRRSATASAARDLLAHHRPSAAPSSSTGAPLRIVDVMPPLGEGPVPVGGTLDAPVLPGSPPATRVLDDTGADDTTAGEHPGTRRLADDRPRTRPVTDRVAEPVARRAAEPSRAPEPTRHVAGTPTGHRWRPVPLAAGLVLLVAAAATAVLLRPSTPTATVRSGAVPGVVVEAGSGCGWAQQGDQLATTDGRTATCLVSGDSLVWFAG